MIYINSETNKEIKDNEILFLGCSHTEGVGHTSKDSVYTHLLAKELNLIPLVDAHRGRGNYVTEEKLNTYNLQNKKVIIQFTDTQRLRLNGKDFDPNNNSNKLTKSQLEVYTDEILLSLFFEQAKRINNLLKANDSTFLFFMLSHTHVYWDIMNNYLKTYEAFCPVSCTKYEYDKANDSMHYGPKSHQFISNMLLTQWHKMYDE